jgi:1,2-phenylacetyl-CoA epoxidase PaaB subunit
VANPASLHFDQHLSRARLGNFPFDDFEIASRLGNLRHLHWSNCNPCRCHKTSCELLLTAEMHLRRKSVLPLWVVREDEVLSPRQRMAPVTSFLFRKKVEPER